MANVFSDITNFLSGGLQGNAVDFLTSAAKGVKDLTTPDLMKLIPELAQQVQQGTMTPEQYQIVTAVMQGTMDPAQATAAFQQASGMQNVKTDAASLQGMRTALAQLSNIAQNKGLTEADRAQFNAIMDQSNANVAQQRAAQVQQLQQQGNAGTGAELAARLAGVQGTANSNAIAGANLATSAQARALQAIQAGLQGNQALNTSQFAQDASKAQAQDAVNQFNAQAKNAVSLANAGMQQQANMANFNTANQINMQNAAAGTAANAQNAAQRQAANLTNFNMANQIAGKNTDILNQQKMLPLQASQQNWTNQLNQQTNAGNLQNTAGKNLADLAKAQVGLSTTGIGGVVTSLAGDAAKWIKDTVTGQVGKIINGKFIPATSAADVAAANAATDVANVDVANSLTGTGGDIMNNSTNAANAANTVVDNVPNVVDNVVNNTGWTSDAWDLFSDKNLKTDKKELKDSDVDSMMAQMTGYKYRYKGPKSNPQQTGIMAQDMAKGMPESVIDTPAGKKVQGPQALSQALAILANQHERIKKLEGAK